MKLGVVAGFEIDAEQQTVACYVIKPALVPRFLTRDLIVGARQVVALTNAKMIVDDGTVPDRNVVTTPVASV